MSSVLPWELVERVNTPNGEGVISLHRRGADFSIRIDGADLMNSWVHGSEEAMAELCCAEVTGLRRPHLLIGGLGMGFTLAACLRCLPPGARVEVAELVGAVISWNRGPLGAVAGDPLRDRRVSVHRENVRAAIQRAKRRYHAILLDVDNGPDGLTQASNQWLYERRGLERIAAALATGGVLSVWSARPDRRFSKRLATAGFKAMEHLVPSGAGKGGGKHTIWLAQLA